MSQKRLLNDPIWNQLYKHSKRGRPWRATLDLSLTSSIH